MSREKYYKARMLAKRDTTYNWGKVDTTFVPLEGEFIVYTDYTYEEDESGNRTYAPAVKIGDGNAYLVDLPFLAASNVTAVLQELREHESDTEVHTTTEQKAIWDSKISCDISGETLILTEA